MRILIVDDSNVIRRAIERAVKSDHEIRMAGNGIEAISVFEDFMPEVVTMDITMPEMDGLTCVDALLERRPDARILVISALGDASTAVEAVRRGAQGFLLKPFTIEALNEEIAELFNDEVYA